MKDFNTKQAVATIDNAKQNLERLYDKWDSCDAVNGSEVAVSECCEPMGIIGSVITLLDIAAGMLEDCSQ